MSRNKKGVPRPADATVGSPAPAAGPEAADWEQRALSRVRPHVRRLAEEREDRSVGWETDTLTRLERYFERDEV